MRLSRFFIYFVMTALCAVLPNITWAATWTGATNSSWFVTTNWSPAALPLAGTAVIINLGSNGPTISSAGALGANVQIGTTATGGIITINGTGTLADTNGYLGFNASSPGTATVDGSSASWTNSAAFNVGNSGTGTLTISNGALVSAANSYLGANSDSAGTATVTGTNSRWTNTADLRVGNNGNGTLTISSGGLASANNSYIGTGAASVSTATVTGTGSSWTSTTGLFVGNTGNGTLMVSAGGVVSTASGRIGHNVGASGTATVTGAGSRWTNTSDLIIANNGSGSLTISAGGVVSDVNARVGNAAGTTGSLTVTGTGSSLNNSSNFFIGSSGTGTLTLSDGGAITNSNGFLGANAGSTGTATVTGTGTRWTNNNGLFVGNSSSGTLTISGGATVESKTFAAIGYNTGVTGTATVTGAGSTWIDGGHLNVSNTGTGIINIENGGRVTVANDLNNGTYSTGVGTVNISSGGRLEIAGNTHIGEFGNGTLRITNGGTLTSVGSWIGDLAGGVGKATVSGSTSAWQHTGNLTIGYINNGTLTISDGASVSTGSGATYGNNGATTISSSLVSIAELQGSVGTLNIGSATGDAAVGAGILVADNVVFGAGTGKLVFNHTDTSYSFAPAISGNGTINVMGGTSVLTGDSSGYLGTTSIASAGTLEINNRLGGSVDVASGGSLRGTGTVGGTHVGNGAIIIPGQTTTASIGTLNVSGNYVQDAGATMRIALQPSAASKLAVSGSATIDGAVVVTPVATTYIRGTSYPILTAGNVSGRFASFVNNAPETVQLGILYGSDNVALIVVDGGVTSFASAAQTTNQSSLASTLDRISPSFTSGAFNTTLNALAALPQNEQSQGLTQLSGGISSGVAANSHAGLPPVFGVLAGRVGSGVAPSGQSFQNSLAAARANVPSFAPSVSNGPGSEGTIADALNRMGAPEISISGDRSIWAQGFGAQSRLGSTALATGMNSTTWGGTMGFEWHEDRSNKFGVLFGAANTRFRLNGGGQTAEQTTYSTGVYGSHTWQRTKLDGSLLLGKFHSTSRREIALLSATAEGETDGFSAGIDTGVGHRLDLGSNVSFTPRAGLRALYANTNAYHETGAPGANLAIDGSSQTRLQTNLGATLAKNTTLSDIAGTQAELHTEASLGWRHDWLNPVISVNESFADAVGSTFTASNADPGRDAAVLGLALSFSPIDNTAPSIYVQYDGGFSANETTNAFTVGLAYRW